MSGALRVGCIVLAAGAGTRFGSDKRLARFGGDTLLARTLGNIAAAFDDRILVLRAGEDVLGNRFAGSWQVVYAAEAGKGMGHSLAAAMPACAGWDGAVVALADMPFVKTATYARVREGVSNTNLVVPYCGGHRGNPVGIGSGYFPELAHLQGDQGARALLQRHAAAVLRVDVDDPGILRDVDAPSALAEGAD